MLIIVYGTTGELIKLLPLIKRVKRSSMVLVSTNQQPEQLKTLYKLTGIKVDINLRKKKNAKDLDTLPSAAIWFLQILMGLLGNSATLRKHIKESATPALLLVHGDTTTTLLGAMLGRSLHLPVAHIEAGLRSFDWRNPFPEEMNRILTSKLARLHFAPGKTPVKNLEKAEAKGEIVDTTFNTVLDSLRYAQAERMLPSIDVPSRFCLVSLHRNELLADNEEFKKILENLAKFSKKIPVAFIDHPITKTRIRALGLDSTLDIPSVRRLPKLSYFNFISILAKADCVITDSGGLQEETAYLGTPCLVHRKASEREEGLGTNVVLSLYEDSRIEDFMKNYGGLKSAGTTKNTSPTEIILENLTKKGYIAEPKK